MINFFPSPAPPLLRRGSSGSYAIGHESHRPCRSLRGFGFFNFSSRGPVTLARSSR
jgi:hypothetical protein